MILGSLAGMGALIAYLAGAFDKSEDDVTAEELSALLENEEEVNAVLDEYEKEQDQLIALIEDPTTDDLFNEEPDYFKSYVSDLKSGNTDNSYVFATYSLGFMCTCLSLMFCMYLMYSFVSKPSTK